MKYDRIQKLKQYMMQTGKASIEELCSLTGVSVETIRRDLNLMESEGVIRKIYGGAVLKDDNATPAAMNSFRERTIVADEEKRRMASKVVELIPDRSIIAMDSGTTMYRITQEMNRLNGLTVVTNSLYNALWLSTNTDHLVYCIGGAVKKDEAITTGFLALSFLQKLSRLDLALIAADGFSLEQGITDYSLEMSVQKKEFIAKSDRVIAVVDHTKFGVNATFGSCALSEINVLVTDSGAPADVLDELRKRDIEVIVA